MIIGFGWTDERIQILKGHVNDGLSCSQIGREMGITRNAVIGKIHRLNGYKPMPKHTQQPVPKPRPRPAPEPEPEPMVFDLPPDSSVFAVPIANLRHGICRWPLGEPSAEMLYCGAASHGSWCPRHRAIVYVPLQRRRA